MSSNAFIACEYENVIKNEITNNNIKDKISSAIGKNSSKNQSRINKEIVLETLRNEGVVDYILTNLLSKSKILSQSNTSPINDRILLSYTHEQLAPPGPGQFLSVTLSKGINFADHLLIDHNLNVNDKFEFSLHQPNNARTGFQFFLSFQKQRISSKIVPCVRDPLINQQFFIKITDGEPENTSVSTLLGLREPLHLVLIRHDFMTHERWLVSSQVIEWRMVLCSDSWSTRINMDLQGVFDECKVNIGSIELVLQLVPCSHRELPIAQDVFNAQLRMENVNYGSEKERKFLVYAKQWWQEFNMEHDGDDRHVKIFAQDENGLNRFVCDYVSPVRAGRILDSPAQASRFVASIPTQTSSSIGTSTSSHDLWKSGLAFLVENRGNVENHASLLCSLLLGFGMNAYVAVGIVKDDTSNRRPHTWVVTFQEEHPNKATFWEASSGKKFSFRSFPHYNPPTNMKLEYINIGCIFNHYQFFANNFKNKSIEMCIFDMNNNNRWKRMSEEIISIVVENKYFEKTINNAANNISWNNRIPLYVSRLVSSSHDDIKMSNDLENQMRTLINRWRSARLGTNVNTKWDDQLCYMLGQALFSYELEQLTGLTNVGNDEFKSSIQRHVKDGYTFKAFPLHVLHINAKLILDIALKSPVFQEIINCRGSDVNLALRVKVFSYAENSTPTWIIFGCSYQFTQ